MNAIKGFRGRYRWLSSFWPAKVTLDGTDFSSVEHAYQAAKKLDVDQRRAIASLAKPGQAKRYGRKLRIRQDWEEVKLAVMEDLLRQKFAHADHAWRDFWWGVCDGKGENHLGRLLMKCRDELRDSGASRTGKNHEMAP
jgi:N-glycosidase YbiA